MEFNLDSYLLQRREQIEAALRKLIAFPEEPGEGKIDYLQLRRAMSYAVLNGGKRLRPCLVLAACEAVGGRSEEAVTAACAVEMVHAYSLVHDDLPAMDNDEMRRGKPTVHKEFGETAAILVGDALLTLAFETLASQQLGSSSILQMVRELSRAAGGRGMVGGQAMDMALKEQSLTFEMLELCHMGKTAALFAASTVIGGLCGQADAEQLELLRGYGFDLGIAFQHADDLADAENTVYRAQAFKRALELAQRCGRQAEKLVPVGGNVLVAFAALIEERSRKAMVNEVSVAN